MNQIMIEDLSSNKELDRKAMASITGAGPVGAFGAISKIGVKVATKAFNTALKLVAVVANKGKGAKGSTGGNKRPSGFPWGPRRR